jgi:hypothetical protein
MVKAMEVIDDDPLMALRQFMDFARSHLSSISK